MNYLLYAHRVVHGGSGTRSKPATCFESKRTIRRGLNTDRERPGVEPGLSDSNASELWVASVAWLSMFLQHRSELACSVRQPP